MILSVLFNMLSAVLTVFSFLSIIPLLEMLFGLNENTDIYTFMPWNSDAPIKEILINNMYYGTTVLIKEYGAPTALLFIGLFLIVTTLLKTGFYFASSAIMVPLRTNVVRDIRVQLYNKVVRLPLSFMSDERKGDIIARMSGDVLEVENSITSSLDMLIKNPILILFYFATMLFTSWELTVFTLVVIPGMGWVMGNIGRKLATKWPSVSPPHIL